MTALRFGVRALGEMIKVTCTPLMGQVSFPETQTLGERETKKSCARMCWGDGHLDLGIPPESHATGAARAVGKQRGSVD